MQYIKLCLASVLQYFSDIDSVALRTTYNTSLIPTKSAIIGLISSALGYDRLDTRINELYSKLDVKYKSIKNPILLEEFQTIKPLKQQHIYMNKQINMVKFTTTSGGKREGQLIKNIQYLQDAEFEIYVGTENIDLLHTIFDALRNPVYSLYIGKRSCIPTKPIVTEFELFNKELLKDVYNCA